MRGNNPAGHEGLRASAANIAQQQIPALYEGLLNYGRDAMRHISESGRTNPLLTDTIYTQVYDLLQLERNRQVQFEVSSILAKQFPEVHYDILPSDGWSVPVNVSKLRAYSKIAMAGFLAGGLATLWMGNSAITFSNRGLIAHTSSPTLAVDLYIISGITFVMGGIALTTYARYAKQAITALLNYSVFAKSLEQTLNDGINLHNLVRELMQPTTNGGS